jgi:hypothetical protein
MNCETARHLLALGALAVPPSEPGVESGESASVDPFGSGSPGAGTAGPAGSSSGQVPPGAPDELRESAWLHAAAASAWTREEAEALGQHLAGCPECQTRLRAFEQEMGEWAGALAAAREAEPSAQLLARARERLDGALDSYAGGGAWARLWAQASFHAGRLRTAPGLATVLLAAGLGLGFWGGYRAGHAVRLGEAREIVLDTAEHPHTEVVADVSQIERVPGDAPGTDRLVVHYDLLTPDTIAGTMDDPSIRRLLVFGLENGLDPAVRAASIDLLASGCRAMTPQTCEAPALRGALVRTLLTDEDARVRLGALDGLEAWVGEDTAVRDAVLHAVMVDRNQEVRMEGIRLLEPVGVDSSVREALHAVAARDEDPVIRSASAEVLAGVPQVQ